jgi:hypothetical protein
VEKVVIGKTTLFYLNQGSVVASLSVWNGDIEPLGTLTDVWVQITGIPPKWVDWDTLREVASSIGLMVEVDWHSLFNSFFSLARARVQCKNPFKIPKERIFVFSAQLYKIAFKPEGYEHIEVVSDDGSEKGDDDIDPEEEDLLDDEVFGKDNGKGAEPAEKEGSDKGPTGFGQASTGQQGPSKTPVGNSSVRRVLMFEDMFQADQAQEMQCTELLKAMELDDEMALETDESLELEGMAKTKDLNHEEAELVHLPEEWIYDMKLQKRNENSLREEIQDQSIQVGQDQNMLGSIHVAS